MNISIHRPQRGIALVVVLVFLVLLSVFIVGFFSNSQDELTAAQSFTGETSAAHLAESAVSVVMGQIREATGRINGAWGSQPGMIRVYRENNLASDKAEAFFKLYSSDDMIVSGEEIKKYDPTNEIPEGGGGWNHLPALWTDLNEPVTVSLPSVGNTGKPNAVTRYPILDPSLNQKVEGLEFITNTKADRASAALPARMPVRWLYVLKDGTLTVPNSSGADGTQAIWSGSDRAPTPSNPIVGRLAFWTDDETSKVNVNTAGGYSLKKEIKKGDGGMPARDEANRPFSEDDYAGSFWDSPRAISTFDVGLINNTGNYTTFNSTGKNKQSNGDMERGGLALSQPVRGEYQRYPGHPSTTSLGIVFRSPPANRNVSMQDAPYALTSGQLALLAPRLNYSFDITDQAEKEKRCSNFGTSRLLVTKKLVPTDNPYLAADDPPGLRVKRLYASVDELFYSQPDPAKVLTQRLQNDVELRNATANDKNTVITADLLEKMRFFLTAHSRAPEINLFGRPRVTLWPVHKVDSQTDENKWWNASDRLLAFCSLIGPDGSKLPEQKVTRFILQRNDSSSPTADAIIERNDKLYTYLQDLTSKPFPGFGKSFSQKYGSSDRDEILTEMIDYMRVVNLRDSIHDKDVDKKYPYPAGGSPGKANVQEKESWKFAPRGLVVPLKFNKGISTVGFGRFPNISEAALVVYHAGYQVGGNANGSGGTRYFLKSEIPNGSNGQAPKPDFDLVRAFMVFETFNPMQGFAPLTSPSGNSVDANKRSIIFELTGLDQFRVDGRNLGMPEKTVNAFNRSSVDFWHGRNVGGSEGMFHMLYKPNIADSTTPSQYSGFPAFPMEDPSDPRFYQFQSTQGLPDMGPDPNHPGIAIPISANQTQVKSVQLTGATLTLKMYYGKISATDLVRTLTLNFPDTTIPVPNGDITDPEAVWQIGSKNPSTSSPFYSIATSSDAGGFLPFGGNSQGYWHPQKNGTLTGFPSQYKSQTSLVKSFAGRMWWIKNADSNNYSDTSGNPTIYYGNRWRQILQPGDVIRSVLYSKDDFRIACLNNDSSIFQPHPDYSKTFYDGSEPSNGPSHAAGTPVYRAHTLRCANGTLYHWDTKFGNICQLPTSTIYPNTVAADLPSTVNGVLRSDRKPGDFDTGLGNLSDGPYCNKPDEGNLVYQRAVFGKDANNNDVFLYYEYPTPYFTWTYQDGFETFFTPNRQIPSAVLFGSLPAGRKANWQTLCFSPNPAGDNHPGRVDPKDYLWLDLFTMPVVEPYAISEPFSTAGKINMNYQIVPFSHIKRSTGMRAALQPVRITAFSTADTTTSGTPRLLTMKTGDPYVLPKFNPATGANINYRYLVDRDETLKAFDYFFSEFSTDKNNGFFKTAAQICDFYLYPKRSSPLTTPVLPDTNAATGLSYIKWDKDNTKIKSWWRAANGSGQVLTGDNVREKPYADLYPRLTTKSNTFCVHVRAQALRQSGAPDPAHADEHYRTWDEKKDRVIGEYRGASIIERYIDPQDERFSPTGADRTTRINVDTQSLDDSYRFRVLNTKRFDP